MSITSEAIFSVQYISTKKSWTLCQNLSHTLFRDIYRILWVSPYFRRVIQKYME